MYKCERIRYIQSLLRGWVLLNTRLYLCTLSEMLDGRIGEGPSDPLYYILVSSCFCYKIELLTDVSTMTYSIKGLVTKVDRLDLWFIWRKLFRLKYSVRPDTQRSNYKYRTLPSGIWITFCSTLPGWSERIVLFVFTIKILKSTVPESS